jgi:putative hydrolase of the HAD superfamily
MIDKAIILDLDDTIFETRSMDPKVFQPFFDHFTASLVPKFSRETIDSIVNDLWQATWHDVLHKYNIPEAAILDSMKVLDNLELNLRISTYPDYAFIRQIKYPKFLVTTSLTSLQESKIKALKIGNDFTRIIINDTFKEKRTKEDIFKDLVREFKLIPERTYVIGDNAESEIKAGNALNMITIQILRENVRKGDNARHYIKSFAELEGILGCFYHGDTEGTEEHGASAAD